MLYSRKMGQGAPLVLLHGLFGSLENMGSLARLLSENHKVYSVDLPDHGRSPHLQTGGLREYAEQLGSWLDAEGLETVDLVGHSLGGKVAMEWALMAPQRVHRLVALDVSPVGYHERHSQIFTGLKAVHPPSLSRRSQADELLCGYVTEAAVRTFLLKNLIKTDKGYRWRLNLAGLEKAYPNLIAANCDGRFDGPVLFLKGGSSDYIMPSHKNAVTERFPLAELKIVSDTGHWLHAENAELVARLIDHFMRKSI